MDTPGQEGSPITTPSIPADPNSSPRQREHTPFWLVILLFLIFQPAALFIILKENYYHRWLPILLWLYSIPLLLTYLVLRTSVIPQLDILYRALDVPNPLKMVNLLTIFFMAVLLMEIIFGFILFRKSRLTGYLSKNLLVITLLFFVVNFVVSPAFIIIGIIAPIYNLTSSLEEPTIPKTMQSLQTSPIPTIDPIINYDSIGANWKTYTAQNDGYTLKYPQDWSYRQVSPFDRGIMFSSPTVPQQSFQILVATDASTLDAIVKDLSNKGSVSDIVIDGVSGKSVDFTMPSPPGYGSTKFQIQEIELLKDNKRYSLVLERPEGSFDNIPKQILQTFKFLDVNHPSQSIEDEGKDTKRKSNLRMIQGGLELFKYDKGKYPKTLAEMTPLYMKMIPVDPNPNNYYFYQAGNDGFSYTLSATLSDGSKYQVNNP